MANQNDVLDLANKVVGKMPSDKKQFGILSMILIGASLIEIFKSCKKLHKNKPRLLELTKNPGIVAKARIHRIVRRHFREHNDEDVGGVVNAMFDAGKEATPDDIDKLVELANTESEDLPDVKL